MDLQQLLKRYKEITEEYMKSFDDLEEVKRLIELRQNILDEIKANKVSREELRVVVESLGIMELEEKVMTFTKGESDKVKQEMLELKRTKSANAMYSSNFNNINFINKRI